MKEYGYLKKCFLLLFVLTTSFSTFAQNNKKEQKQAEIQQLMQAKRFVFVAEYASPLGGRVINLTSLYDLKLSPDSLVAELPYYGRAFVAPLNPSEGGINFTSTNFTYNINPTKKGGWDITILLKDKQDVTQMFLSVSANGYASLQVTSNNRQEITFTGYITSRSKFK